MRKLPLRGRWQAEGGEKISDFQVLLSLSVEGDRAPALLFFLALYRFQNVTHFIYCIISSCFSRLPPLRTRNPAAKETTILNRIPPTLSPPNQGWSHAKAKTHHFPLLDLGVEWEGYNFPIHDVQDCRSVQDDTKSLWFSYVKGCYYTHTHNTSPILFFFADLHMMMYKDWLLSQKQRTLDRMEHLSWPWFFAAKDLTLKKKTKNILSSSPNE